MTTSNVASAVNPSTITEPIEELSIIIAAQDLTPTMMSQDFLKLSGIIPKEWQLSQQPVLNPNLAQLNFTNGVSITAQPHTITVRESLGNRTEELAIATVAAKYIEKLPHADYLGFGMSPKILIPFPNNPATVREFITSSLLGAGSWKKIGQAPVQASINLMYLLDRCQLTISVSEARLQQPEQPPITAILFSGNFNYSVNSEGSQEKRLAQVQSFLSNWKNDLAEFRDIVNHKFLDSNVGSAEQFFGETSLFPGQTL